MAFHFKKKESPTRAVRRLSRERIGKALEYLRQSGRLEAIHSVRKEIKKLRATLGLVRGKMGENAYRKRVKTLRTAAKCLQDPRDARVRPQALERLVERYRNRLPARPFAGIKKVLKQNCRAEVHEFGKGKSVRVVGRLLQKIDRRAGDLKVKADGWTAIQPGLQESYRQGRKRVRNGAQRNLAEKSSSVAETRAGPLASTPAASSDSTGKHARGSRRNEKVEPISGR